MQGVGSQPGTLQYNGTHKQTIELETHVDNLSLPANAFSRRIELNADSKAHKIPAGLKSMA
jgi:hypothetical protein